LGAGTSPRSTYFLEPFCFLSKTAGSGAGAGTGAGGAAFAFLGAAFDCLAGGSVVRSFDSRSLRLIRSADGASIVDLRTARFDWMPKAATSVTVEAAAMAATMAPVNLMVVYDTNLE